MSEDNHSSVGTYILIALILGVITYVEFAIVEYDLAWLSNATVLWTLIILSVAKFLLVVMYFMHLKGDDAMYTGFFASGMVFAFGTFLALAVMFTLPSSVSFVRGQFAPPTEPAHEEEHEGLDEATRQLVDSDGYSRDLPARLDAPPPRTGTVRWSTSGPEAEFAVASAATQADQAEADDAEAEAADEGDDAAEADEPEAPADDAGDGDGESVPDPELGAEVYAANCASCHQAEGGGVPGAFPPLADHVASIAEVEGGRTYLVDVLLAGLQGPIEVDGSEYDGMMPGWSQLGDDEIAAVINHAIFELGDGADVDGLTPGEVAERRDGLSAQDVFDRRAELDLP